MENCTGFSGIWITIILKGSVLSSWKKEIMDAILFVSWEMLWKEWCFRKKKNVKCDILMKNKYGMSRIFNAKNTHT